MTNEDNVAKRLGGRVRHFRLLIPGMTEEKLGYLLKRPDGRPYSQRTISEMELGDREIKPSELGQIARALNIKTSDLTRGLGYKNEPIEVTGGGKAGARGGGERA